METRIGGLRCMQLSGVEAYIISSIYSHQGASNMTSDLIESQVLLRTLRGYLALSKVTIPQLCFFQSPEIWVKFRFI